MVLPSPAAGSRKPRRKSTTDILVVIAVTVIAVGAAWIVTLSLLNRSNSPKTEGKRKAKGKVRLASPSGESKRSVPASSMDLTKDISVGEEAAKNREDNGAVGGVMHLSAKSMLATKRPYIMYGTAWKKDATGDLVFQAIHAGFRFIDTACQPKHYDEAGVGYGWKLAADQLGLAREDLFLQTKFTSVNGQDINDMPYVIHARLEDQVRQSVHASLRNLKTDYIDSLVLHSPMPKMEDTLKVWEVLESLVEDGKIRQLGISNCYDPGTFANIYMESQIKPKVLQNRFHAQSNFDVELRKMCKKYGVEYQSFWTLTANRQALASPDWKAVAKEKGLTPQTLMYAFMMELGHTPLSGTKDSGHMEEDVDIMLRFQRGEKVLSDDDLGVLSSLLGIHHKA